ncbi:hypothetical protein PPYR_01476 [Photinus pyralis]|uniref:Integrase zinc-binding domain-containing protein n=1 Tax=Photinus pyralis TaxID=7054 RepID=A0A5N4B4L0_PHOPY|nr:hypothetical protein PPYR_01476 [Photinus pyralis]
MTNVTNLILNLNHDESLKTLGVGSSHGYGKAAYAGHLEITHWLGCGALAKFKASLGGDFKSITYHWGRKITRCVATDPTSSLELHGFSDASVRAYGACIYIREILVDNSVRCQLLCAKSRVAPLKTLTLPKLELCAALLLTDLVDKVLNSSRKEFARVIYYCDSTITLSWIKDFIFNKFSTFETLIRVTAFCKRFINNCRDKSKKVVGKLLLLEINEAEATLVKMVQEESFGDEIRLLKQSKNLNSNSPILSLNPFLDGDILRVGGRLRHSDLAFSKKFPILLPKSHAFTNLVIRNDHIKALHGGVQTTLSQIRLRYWPIHGRSVTQKILRQCVVCFTNKRTPFNYKMGDLPKKDNAPSRHWKLGRVTKVHPGPDNVVRAATIKTSHGEVKRPSVRFCVLPTN